MTKKLKLDFDELEVESFAAEVGQERGTAVAFVTSVADQTCRFFCSDECATNDPGDPACISYVYSCPPTVYVYETCVC